MTELRKAAEMALEYFEDAYGLEDAEVEIKEALRQALDETPPCKTHPDAPHGFDRNASHSADRYVCECEGWEPVDAVDISEERVHISDKSIHEPLYMDMSQVPKGMPNWKPGMVFPSPEKEWVGLTVNEVLELLPSSKWKAEETLLFVQRIEDELREKNSP